MSTISAPCSHSNEHNKAFQHMFVTKVAAPESDMLPFTVQWQCCTAPAAKSHSDHTMYVVKFLFCFSVILWTPQLFQYILLYYTLQPSKSAKKKAAGITKARQSCHTSRTSNPPLWVPDFETSPITPEDSRSSSPSFIFGGDQVNGTIMVLYIGLNTTWTEMNASNWRVTALAPNHHEYSTAIRSPASLK